MIYRTCFGVVCLLLHGMTASAAEAPGDQAPVVFPLDRTAYVIGEKIPLAFGGEAEGARTLEAVDAAGRRITLYSGTASALVLDTDKLAAGSYAIHVDGKDSGTVVSLVDAEGQSAGAFIDEVLPPSPRLSREVRSDPPARAKAMREWRQQTVQTLRETGINVAFNMGAAEMGRNEVLDPMTAAGALALVNPYTRPMSFIPARVYGPELAGMRQRMSLTAQANGRYPSFGGFCFTWDPTGFVGSRKGLFVYWQWGEQEQALRAYLARSEKSLYEEFRRRTGLEPVGKDEYLAYLLSIRRPEFAPAIDLPTMRWIEQMAVHVEPLEGAALEKLEKRIDAWTGFLMGLYEETHADFIKHLDAVEPSLVHTAAVNVDHCPVREGQYTPSAYRGLDLRYIGAWNDQIAGPDYAYQWLFSAAMLNVERSGQPVWVTHALGQVHGNAPYPGKLVRAIAHNLAHGGSGTGFSLEAFSNVLGGMNRQTQWQEIRGTPAAEAVRTGHDFLDRLAFLALEGRGKHGVALLYSKTQMARQHIVQKMGTPQYRALIALTRLGYTPRFVTEDEIAEGKLKDFEALVVVGQTFPLPDRDLKAIDRFKAGGGRVLVDGNTTIAIPAAEPLGVTIPFETLGRPYNWSSPNIPRDTPHITVIERWYADDAPPMLEALGDTGRAVLAPAAGAQSDVTVMQIDGGRDAIYLAAINDSSIRSHTDWHQVRELLSAAKCLPDETAFYDVTEERSLGRVRQVRCDLTQTTARVFALLPRPVERTALSATQKVTAGSRLGVQVRFLDPDGKPLDAALPLHLSLLRPDGKSHLACYRSTNREGTFTFGYDLPLNVPTGEWRLAVRSQLTGQVAELPVRVDQPTSGQAGLAKPLTSRVVVRQREAMERLFSTRSETFVIPLFENDRLDQLRPLAEKVRSVLGKRGVRVEIVQNPPLVTYWLAYDPTPEQAAENARADRGQAIGRIKVTTVNRNDYFSALGGYRFGRNVILLDLAGEDDNPLAEHLQGSGMLWPEVSGSFPGPGRAVVQLVHRAFDPERSALVIQAADVAGLKAGVASLASLPPDWITPSVAAARQRLLGQLHVGGRPDVAARGPLTSDGLRLRTASEPFRLRFGEAKPPTPEAISPWSPPKSPAVKVPGAVDCESFVPQVREGEGDYVEAWTPGGQWKSDLRFVDAILIPIHVARGGPTAIVAEGVFRYSDRRPRSQGSWEEFLALYKKIVPARRDPMHIEVWLDGKAAGRLEALTTARREIPIEMLPGYVKEKPRSVEEDLVVQIRGRVELPVGRHELLLIPRHIVDGKLDKVHIGVGPAGQN